MTMPLNLLIATIAILSPDVRLDSPPAPLSAFAGVAIQLELLSPRETAYYFARREDFASDLESIRRRSEELVDAPPACDAVRFPDVELCNEMCSLSLGYRGHLEELRLIDHSAWIDKAMTEADQLYRVWDLARDIGHDYYYVTYRRAALRDLRELIGAHAYYAGCLPPAVPVWRLRRVE